ncbi:MAG: MoaD/ThiS family protein [Xanthobacteraceae bacterium]|nr:MoaD/ThiS family protein [Xanthobacteraceae bacterium]QYK45683.1 MAG: MoaD/ThiS family protein [Xanthobacteraceae bacterium]
MSILVHARLHGLLRLIIEDPEGRCEVQLEPEASVNDFLDRIDARNKAWIVSVNGTLRRGDYKLRNGDEIDCYPQLNGG